MSGPLTPNPSNVIKSRLELWRFRQTGHTSNVSVLVRRCDKKTLGSGVRCMLTYIRGRRQSSLRGSLFTQRHAFGLWIIWKSSNLGFDNINLSIHIGCLHEFDIDDDQFPFSLAISSNSDLIAAELGLEESIRIWNLVTNTHLQCIPISQFRAYDGIWCFRWIVPDLERRCTMWLFPSTT